MVRPPRFGPQVIALSTSGAAVIAVNVIAFDVQSAQGVEVPHERIVDSCEPPATTNATVFPTRRPSRPEIVAVPLVGAGEPRTVTVGRQQPFDPPNMTVSVPPDR